MLHNIEGHGIGEEVLDIIINATKIIIITTTKIITIIIQSQIGSWMNWSWTSGRATEAPPLLISYQSLTTLRQPLFLSWEYLIILQCDCIIVVGNHCQYLNDRIFIVIT